MISGGPSDSRAGDDFAKVLPEKEEPEASVALRA